MPFRDSNYPEILPDLNDYWRFYYNEEKEGIPIVTNDVIDRKIKKIFFY